MNERIQKLAIGCAIQLDWDFPSDPKEYTFSSAGVEKFAELIIKECASLCNNFDVYYADNSPLKREVALETAHDLADMILEHFGIEE